MLTKRLPAIGRLGVVGWLVVTLAGCGSSTAAGTPLPPSPAGAPAQLEAAAMHVAITEFSISRAAGTGGNTVPYDITAGPDGAMWFTEQSGDAVGRITSSGAISEYPLHTLNAQPQGITAGADGNLYVAENAGPNPYQTHVARVTPTGAVTQWNDNNAMPMRAADGPNATVWFTQYCGDLAVLDVKTGALTHRYTPTGMGGTQGSAGPILQTPDGSMWFSDDGSVRIGRIAPDGTYRTFRGMYYQGKYGDSTLGATVGPDGNVWWTAVRSNAIWATNAQGKIVHVFHLPTANAAPWGIVKGADGALWFTELIGNKIGRVTVQGKFTEFALATSASRPQGIAVAPDGSLWFVESGANKIGRIVL